jgi:hypothetical protein
VVDMIEDFVHEGGAHRDALRELEKTLDAKVLR